MEKFQAIEPSLELKPYIKQYWFLLSDAKFGTQRIIPSGCIGLAFNRSEHIVVRNKTLPKAYLFGLTNEFVDTSFNFLDLVIIIFQPLGAKAIFNIPINELCGQNISIDYLQKPELIELYNRLVNNEDNISCTFCIEKILMKLFIMEDKYSLKRLIPVINLIEQGITDIGLLANTSCLSYKQFSRIFKESIGLNPKEYLQIHRFSKTVNQLQLDFGEKSIDEIALTNGYYDKSHLIKEFKSYSGFTPSEFISNSDPYSEYMSLFQRFFVNT